MKVVRIGFLFVLALLVLLPAGLSSPATAVPSGTTFVARFGDPLPAPPFPPGSGVYQLSPPDVNDAGQTSFYVRSNLGPCGVVIGDGTSPLVVHAIDGDPGGPFPGFPMEFCGQVGARPLTNSAGAIAYVAELISVPGPDSLHLSPAPGPPIHIVTEGETSADPPGTFGPPQLLDFNDGNTVLFSADVTGDTVVDALFSSNGGPISTLVKVGDSLPPRLGGGSIGALGSAVMDNAGKVAFEATVGGDSVILLRGTGGSLTEVVAEDDIWFTTPALDILGGEESGAECDNALDDDGDGRINDGCPVVVDPEQKCRNSLDDDGDTKVNDGCSTEVEVRFLSVDEPAINDNGVVAFHATLPSPYSEGYFFAETGSPYEDGSASCFDGVDNGGDTLTDGADADCSASTDPHEDGHASCSDNLDNGSDGVADNNDPDCQAVQAAVMPENPSIVGDSFGGGSCTFDLAGGGPHLLGNGSAGAGLGFPGFFVKQGCGGDPTEAVMVFPSYDAAVLTGEVIPGGSPTQTWIGFSDPAISESGRVAFKGTTTDSSGESVATSQEYCDDSDGDGLCDKWEEDGGIDANNNGTLDLILPQADKDRKDIYVEVDYMDCAQGGCEAEGVGAALGTCGDGIDNDGDGDIDGFDTDGTAGIEDPECNAATTDTHNHKPNGGIIEDGVVGRTCDDGNDNGGDGLTDTDDPDCAVVAAFANSTAYNPTDSEGVGTCSDGLDHDGDTLTDAEDPDCTGINLHVLVDESIRHYQYLDFPPAPGKLNPKPCEDGVGGTNYGGAKPYSFNAVKSAHFGSFFERNFHLESKAVLAAKRKVFHYALFTHMQTPSNSSSGCAEILGNDFYVSLGAWAHEDGAGPFTCSDTADNGGDTVADGNDSDCTSGSVGTPAEHEGTFMHELGHNLGLRHGGDDELNWKPNYLSVMNYAFQMPYTVPSRPLDYSRWVLPPPDEDASGVPGSCADGLDNASDGKTDFADPDCWKPPALQDEGFRGIVGSCSDGLDNDLPADGLIDLEDPDCSVGQLNEFSLDESSGIDGGQTVPGLASLQTAYTELPNEFGVDADGDTLAEDLNSDGQIRKSDNEKGPGSCTDAIDNDGDTKIDTTVGNPDPGCVRAWAPPPLLSLVGEGPGSCTDGVDNDFDGRIDVNVGNADPDCECKFRQVPATGAIDWNINNSIEGAGASPNVDTPIKDPKEGGVYQCRSAVPNQVLEGWDDWHNLKLYFRGSGNYSDGLPNVPVPEEPEDPSGVDSDGDLLWDMSDPCPNNTDCDGDNYGDYVEAYMGTDPADDCPDTSTANDEAPDPWPPDMDDDRDADIVDVLKFKPVIMTSVPPSPPRFDFDADGDIDIVDVMKYKPVILTSCSP